MAANSVSEIKTVFTRAVDYDMLPHFVLILDATVGRQGCSGLPSLWRNKTCILATSRARRIAVRSFRSARTVGLQIRSVLIEL